MGKPLAIDLFCGIGGWAHPLLDLGYRVVGFDTTRYPQGYPGDLVLQDVCTIDGRRLAGAAVIVASPPCQEFSLVGMPWAHPQRPRNANLDLVNEVWRIRDESGVPTILENVRALQYYVGRAEAHFGPFYLWGDVPLLRPTMRLSKHIHGRGRRSRKFGDYHRAPHLRAAIPYDLGLWVGQSFLREAV